MAHCDETEPRIGDPVRVKRASGETCEGAILDGKRPCWRVMFADGYAGYFYASEIEFLPRHETRSLLDPDEVTT
jgi:hypothetical protein